MKRKLLSLIMIMMLLPIASLFGACGKEKSYNLDSLSKDYNSIVEENNNVIASNGALEFKYSAKLTTVINETSPYNQLPKYNEVFYNLMSFANEYIVECSSDSKTKNSAIKNQVEKDLNSLKESIYDVNECVNVFAEIINISESVDVTAPTCLLRFENLLVSYEKLFASAINFNNTLSDLYFNNILREGNPDVYSKGLENFDSSVVVNKLKSRLCYQKSNLSQCFVEMYVGADLANKISNKETTFDLNKYSYQSNINKINRAFTEAQAVEIANNSANKADFYDLAISAYNLQEVLKNEQYKFVQACNEIEYPKVKNSETASAKQLMCVDIVESRNMLVSTYNSFLAQMLDIITSAN